jgi:hypothetical protein
LWPHVASALELIHFEHIPTYNPRSIGQWMIGSNLAAINGKPESAWTYNKHSSGIC